ncbi:Ras-specific guanine nucleotide-releasing factor RalGPS1 [Trichinella murrelli]|uniref:Ras-specific guanine nucleotide-releasing factor RalGPS1 n=1 Tax=Trichinella murrelli TaxID=144512 RepID=A0A0V0TLS6_9BILA|nr:Ras-specific guanine nucleotide-releasing factor RalGPS1 [Trichinella murrelli]
MNIAVHKSIIRLAAAFIVSSPKSFIAHRVELHLRMHIDIFELMERRSSRKYSMYDEGVTKCLSWSTSAQCDDGAGYSPSALKLQNRQFDPVTFNVLKVNPEDIAAQLTLGDLPIFKAIKPDELTSCAWNSRNKLTVAPNVVSFIRRFNHVCLWCQKEILSCQSLKLRAEVLGHFLKISKKLMDLNNIHSAFAIISGLQSSAVYRLYKTWAAVQTKDKAIYDKLTKLFSDQNNWEKLRKYMMTIKLPCIPYLGLYLTDLIYIDVAHPSSGGLESTQRLNMMNNILRVLADYQSSNYESLSTIDCFQSYLDSIRYIDELQNLSIKLEPNCNSSSVEKNFKHLLISDTNGTPLKTQSLTPQTSKSKQTHRKTQSLGGSNLVTKVPSIGNPLNETFPLTVDCRRHLLDDSLLEFSSCTASSSSLQLPSNDVIGDSGHESSDENGIRLDLKGRSSSRDRLSRSVDTLEEECIIEGPAKRKCILKNGHRPRFPVWRRFWIRLCGSALYVYESRNLPRNWNSRLAYKTYASKIIALCGWMVVKTDDPFMPDSFILQEPVLGIVYRLRVGTQANALRWVEKLKVACEDPRTKFFLRTWCILWRQHTLSEESVSAKAVSTRLWLHCKSTEFGLSEFFLLFLYEFPNEYNFNGKQTLEVTARLHKVLL